jgi:hypothetical protein
LLSKQPHHSFEPARVLGMGTGDVIEESGVRV